MTKMKLTVSFSMVILAMSLVGCGGGGDSSSSTLPPATPPTTTPAAGSLPKMPTDIQLAEAGVPVGVITQPSLDAYRQVASTKNFGRRPDPFALLGPEAIFERDQQRERVFSETGFFGTIYEEPEDTSKEEIRLEPQPYRRLVGVLLGDGVSALIQMEDGKVYDVRPGSKIVMPTQPPTEWTVQSIDADRAVIRRGGNVLPKEVIVRLEPDPNATFGGPQGGNNPQGGSPDDPSGGAGRNRPGANGAQGGGGSPQGASF